MATSDSRDSNLLNSLYTERLQNLRQRAEGAGISKSGSVEVLRARLISQQVLSEHDLSWEGIQSMSHKEMGDVKTPMRIAVFSLSCNLIFAFFLIPAYLTETHQERSFFP